MPLAAILAGQFDAALYMLDSSLRAATDDDWNAKVANGPLRVIVYHTLFYVDYYLSDSADAFALRDLHHKGGDERGAGESPGLSRDETLAYLALCREKMHAQLDNATDAHFYADCGFPRRDFTRAEMHIYNLRHLQHHVGAVQAHLRRAHPDWQDPSQIPWRGKGWPGPRINPGTPPRSLPRRSSSSSSSRRTRASRPRHPRS